MLHNYREKQSNFIITGDLCKKQVDYDRQKGNLISRMVKKQNAKNILELSVPLKKSMKTNEIARFEI